MKHNYIYKPSFCSVHSWVWQPAHLNNKGSIRCLIKDLLDENSLGKLVPKEEPAIVTLYAK